MILSDINSIITNSSPPWKRRAVSDRIGLYCFFAKAERTEIGISSRFFSRFQIFLRMVFHAAVKIILDKGGRKRMRKKWKKAACLLTISDKKDAVATAEERQTAFRQMMEIALDTAIGL